MEMADAFLVDRLRWLPPDECVYCQAFPSIPCALHQYTLGASRAAGRGPQP